MINRGGPLKIYLTGWLSQQLTKPSTPRGFARWRSPIGWLNASHLSLQITQLSLKKKFDTYFSDEDTFSVNIDGSKYIDWKCVVTDSYTFILLWLFLGFVPIPTITIDMSQFPVFNGFVYKLVIVKSLMVLVERLQRPYQHILVNVFYCLSKLLHIATVMTLNAYRLKSVFSSYVQYSSSKTDFFIL